MAGYSGTPLAKKLGLKPGLRLAFLAPPDGHVERLGVSLDAATLDLEAGPFDWIQGFFLDREALDAALPRLRRQITPAGMIWLCWPKKASGVPTDLSDAVVRGAGLAVGLVDIKVCAVDEVWSGLKFVIPVKERPLATAGGV
jgi:hypothetical protein